MDNLSVSLDLKGFQSLLSGIANFLYFSDSGSNVEIDETQLSILTERLYKSSELDSNEIANEINLYISIIKKAANDNWTTETLSEFLLDRSFPKDYAQIFTAYWMKDGPKIHKKLLLRVSFNNQMKELTWRVDMKAMSKASSDINEPVASFEMNFSQPSNKQGAAKFDMSRTEVSQMLGNLEQIQSALESLVSK